MSGVCLPSWHSDLKVEGGSTDNGAGVAGSVVSDDLSALDSLSDGGSQLDSPERLLQISGCYSVARFLAKVASLRHFVGGAGLPANLGP